MKEKPSICWNGLAEFGFRASDKVSFIQQPAGKIKAISPRVHSLSSNSPDDFGKGRGRAEEAEEEEEKGGGKGTVFIWLMKLV